MKFEHQIIGVLENRKYINIKIFYNSSLELDTKALKNICSLIQDYETLRCNDLEIDSH
jgi:hypothetical protein